MDTTPHKRHENLGRLLMILSLALPIALVVWLNTFATPMLPSWLINIVAGFSALLMFEVAAHYELSPRDGPVEAVFRRYARTRDRITYAGAVVVLLVVALLPQSMNIHFSLLGDAAYFLAALLLAYGVCPIFGTPELCTGTTPGILKTILKRQCGN
jgi:hypothetical protein